MNLTRTSILKAIGVIITAALLGVIFYLRGMQSYESAVENNFNSNFFFFWLSGRMTLDGENPYNEAHYLAGHDAHGVTWKPNKIFPYPLPLSAFMIPLGLLSLPDAFLAWQIVSQGIAAVIVWMLLDRWKNPAHTRLFLPVMIFLTFFGPLYLTLQTGAISAFTLLAIFISMLLFEKGKSLAAGIALSLTILKPPQGLTILLLAGVWFFARRDWKAFLGLGIGGVLLLTIGLIQDPHWVTKFLAAGQAVMDRTLGIQSNVWAFSYLACRGASPCSFLLGGAGALLLLSWGGTLLWKNHKRFTPWESFNIILPFGFVSTIYLWAYDQLPYILPVVWIVGTLVERRKSYLQAFLFLILLDIVSLAALALHASTLKDVWSLGNTLLVLGTLLFMLRSKRNAPIDKPSPSA